MIETRWLAESASAGQLLGARGEVPGCVLEHPRVAFFSYPYEWTFAQLKAAALAHLDLQIAALELDAALSDATPYNMQSVGGRMQLIDVLSLRPYQDGEMWVGYNQFCRLFLLPLLLEAWSGVPFQPLLRGSLDGMHLADAVRMLPARKRWLTINGLMHVTLHASQELSHSRARTGKVAARPTMPKSRVTAPCSRSCASGSTRLPRGARKPSGMTTRSTTATPATTGSRRRSSSPTSCHAEPAPSGTLVAIPATTRWLHCVRVPGMRWCSIAIWMRWRSPFSASIIRDCSPS